MMGVGIAFEKSWRRFRCMYMQMLQYSLLSGAVVYNINATGGIKLCHSCPFATRILPPSTHNDRPFTYAYHEMSD